MTNLNPSKPVRSSQAEPHPRLVRVLDAHLGCPSLAPLHPPSVAAFEALQGMVCAQSAPLVLDSGCGTGESTRRMARLWPDCLVVGVDKSAERLRRGGARVLPHREGNAVWLRADLATFWRLAARAGWRLQRHFLLYPNPWPKPGQLRRRWHAHPVFPDLLRLGGVLEMRCNWEPYAREFAFALEYALGMPAALRPAPESEVTSPFERKYRASGHALYAVTVDCG